MEKYLLLFCLAAFLAACTSTKVKPDGSPKGALHWPNKVTLDKHKGVFVNLEDLNNVHPGATRDELYTMFGRPHFTEGFKSREWNYLFYFSTPGHGEGGVSSCQFKVLFDKDRIAQNFYWKVLDPVDGHCPPQQASLPETADKIGGNIYNYTLNIDTLFAFNSSRLNPDELKSLDYLADELKNSVQPQHILIIGHSDRLGRSAYNQRLSEARAMAVRTYLITQRLPAEIISTQGKGERDPIKTCPVNMGRAALIDCLAPNRRIEIVVAG